MDFAFTEEQDMIRESAAGFLADVSTSEAIRSAMESESGFDSELWQRICEEMVWPAIHIPEAYGGMGLGYVELAALLEQMGKHLLCSPFYSSVCLGANALLVAGSEQQKLQWLPEIIEGSATATLAYTGLSGRWDASAIEATYKPSDQGYEITGDFRFVPDGHTASLLVVAARRQGSVGEEGIGLFLVRNDAIGVACQWTPTMDQTRKQANVTLKSTVVDADQAMINVGSAWDELATILCLANIAVAAEQMGGAQQITDMAVSYTFEREQFGRSIASYQAIKHKASDMTLKNEVSRSAVYYAACVAQEALLPDGDREIAAELSQASSMAKAYCSDSYFYNAGSAIQLFGGVGFTWEYDVHLYFKRAKSSETFLGNSSYHREKIAKELLDTVSFDDSAARSGARS